MRCIPSLGHRWPKMAELPKTSVQVSEILGHRIGCEGFSLKTFFRLVQKRLPTVSVGFVSSVRFGTPFVLCVSSFADQHSSLVVRLASDQHSKIEP